MAIEDTHLGYITLNTYINYVKKENEKILEPEIAFFINKIFLFQGISLKKFLYCYYNLFDFHVENKEQILSLENINLNGNLILIREGEIEVSLNINFFEIDLLIKRLQKLLGTKEDFLIDESINFFKQEMKHNNLNLFSYTIVHIVNII